jgi:hypothetical protein
MSKSEKQADPIQSQHPLPRREWLTAFAAGGLSTMALGCKPYRTSPHEAQSPELELRSIKAAVEPLRTTDYVAEAKRQGILDQDFRQELAADVNQFLGTTYQALVYSELVSQLPEDVRNSEEVQSDIVEMSPILDQAVADSYFVLGMADDELMADIDRELKENPDVLMDMAAALDEDGARHGMGIHGRLRLRRASAHLSSRLRMQSTKGVVADVTDKIARIAERNHVERGDGMHFGASLAARRMMDFEDVPSVSPAPPAPPSPQSSLEAERLERKAKRLFRVSGGLAGVGAALLISGGFALSSTGAIGWAVAITFGALSLLIALFILGAAVRRRNQAKKAQSQSADGP